MDLLIIDLTKRRCSVTYHRLVPTFFFDLLNETQHDEQPKRFELRGLSYEDKDIVRVKIEEHEATPENESFLVKQAGCTRMSLGTQAPLPTFFFSCFEGYRSCESDELVLSKGKIDEAAECSTDITSVPQQSFAPGQYHCGGIAMAAKIEIKVGKWRTMIGLGRVDRRNVVNNDDCLA